ncbi:MAG: hypothetical protein QF447_05920 [Candidatus Thioglobus sp.]|jgi:hypothetical protein|nr:hypothetical protein [Candidatus Thioglobus sp.]|tara:strand:+ start:115 stop:522 length:408 start_codon:yes stop_codon:yes gene_type:complete
MFKFLKKEPKQQPVKNIQQDNDWTREIKKNKVIDLDSEQLSFLYYNDSERIDLGTKQGLSRDHLKILKKCKKESTAVELMNILGRTNKTKFKLAIIYPLIDHGFIELTIPDKPKSPNQKYRVTNKFVKRRIKLNN